MLEQILERLTPDPKVAVACALERVDDLTLEQCRLELYWMERWQEVGRLNRTTGPRVMAKLKDRITVRCKRKPAA
ncbi:hypothetical protein FIV42_08145 [Persicimonas caeni]|uniref:Uncharacterized protein n=1 Tax=Persicimonas caeni TaxID=2292766 RepID=A0A4Y6PRF7_PERCE|nr:hypothetical protein [Persicimonas caeni]QDG50699.1 hypothetical protein FIV42_08145 [Persicimonas caeni]QED31920.1 hypothetical protein FRD00_08140 [Persicimonas caeni]